jgi:hypothetical protein
MLSGYFCNSGAMVASVGESPSTKADEVHPSGCRCSACFRTAAPTLSSSEEKKLTAVSTALTTSPAFAERGMSRIKLRRPPLSSHIPRDRGAYTRLTGRKTFNDFELRVATITGAAVACDTTGSVLALNLLAEGDDTINRDGRLVFNHSIELNGVFVPQTVGGTAPGCGRVILLWDKYPSGAAVPACSAIFTAVNGFSQIATSNLDRYEILYDSLRSWGQSGATYEGDDHGVIRIPILHLRDKISYYTTSGATYPVLSTGGLLIATMGSQAAGSSMNLVFDSRLRFFAD